MSEQNSKQEVLLDKSEKSLSLKDIKSFKESLKLKGNFYSETERTKEIIIEGFALKKKGIYKDFDLKYLMASNNYFSIYNKFIK